MPIDAIVCEKESGCGYIAGPDIGWGDGRCPKCGSRLVRWDPQPEPDTKVCSECGDDFQPDRPGMKKCHQCIDEQTNNRMGEP